MTYGHLWMNRIPALEVSQGACARTKASLLPRPSVPDSSAVEQSTVNRLVAGSNPAPGANTSYIHEIDACVPPSTRGGRMLVCDFRILRALAELSSARGCVSAIARSLHHNPPSPASVATPPDQARGHGDGQRRRSPRDRRSYRCNQGRDDSEALTRQVLAPASRDRLVRQVVDTPPSSGAQRPGEGGRSGDGPGRPDSEAAIADRSRWGPRNRAGRILAGLHCDDAMRPSVDLPRICSSEARTRCN